MFVGSLRRLVAKGVLGDKQETANSVPEADNCVHVSLTSSNNLVGIEYEKCNDVELGSLNEDNNDQQEILFASPINLVVDDDESTFETP